MHIRMSMPFFLRTITIGVAQGDSECSTNLVSRSFLRSSYTLTMICGAIERGRCATRRASPRSRSHTTPRAGAGAAFPSPRKIFRCRSRMPLSLRS
ncbi:hypothetical protein PF005_g24538 [Phytophthora fragariae]|uniref:Secreted protein n=1 Tax=Phytophthora fragariae TaxID=53985 RepID=A0A6A3QHU6_9STRA|nr:hypothetical protein PF009_g24249 [Phytophthora fragariae]KAE9076649.1 hypothetical protein PF007_g24546 [Phytophthora fragariae]KAE9079845.1 hypothetical protein PF010_g22605 [Phytophthora fragariae]KAE9096109.1 hypothetical protein PF006_g23854 [Phytophthora fragariae]KAE9177341.1 hypothetical protein PF005_g24538 [Phytophthora fragariae]